MSDDDVLQPTRRGAGLFEWAVAAVIIVATVANFVRVDSTSHSASDTLINWVPQTAALIVVGVAIVSAVHRCADRRASNSAARRGHT